jgi:geranylgeranyl diphosphate synthase type I
MIVAAPESLDQARSLVLPALDAALDDLHPHMALIARYHLGLVEADGRVVAKPGGKYLRPALALLSAQAAGADRAVGVPAGVAVEFVHDFSLLHDDVMDRDEQRRHRPTAWKVFGQADAILAGDALLSLAISVILGRAGVGETRAVKRLNRAVADLVVGQADDLSFEVRDRVSVDECTAMCRKKTGALLACSSALGAELAQGPSEMVECLDHFGMHLGLAFQAVDDLLGIWGAPGITGKPHSDLRNGKNSLPVCFALEADPGGPLAELSGRRLEGDAAERAATLIEKAGGRDETKRLAENEIGSALEALEGAQIESHARSGLTELARFIKERGF